jgi:hypothetical protein
MADKESLAWCVHVDDGHGVRRLVARVVRVTGEGLRNPRWSWGSQPHEAFADFEVHAYLDREHERAWAPGHSFAPFHLEWDQAESVVRVLRKIRKGLEAADRDAGYLPADDVAAYLFRIAAILRVRAYYVRNTDQARAISGDIWHPTDAAGVQDWVTQTEKGSANRAHPTNREPEHPRTIPHRTQTRKRS